MEKGENVEDSNKEKIVSEKRDIDELNNNNLIKQSDENRVHIQEKGK